MNPVRLGIVGCAHACKDLHRPWLAAHPEQWEVRGLFDLKRELAESEAKAFGGPARAEDSLDALLGRKDIEVVLVLTKPPTTHHKVAMKVVEAGKGCWIEKPFAETTAECDEILAAAKRTKAALFVYQNRRWDPNFTEARQIVEDGRLGTIQYVQIGFGASGYDWGIHVMDEALRFGNGALRQVYGWSADPAGDAVPSTVDLLFEKPPTVRVQFLPSTPETADRQKFARFYMIGTGRMPDGRNFELVTGPEAWPHQAKMYRHLYAWMREGGPRPLDPIGARNAVYAFELMRESARQGRSIAPDKWMPEDDAAFVV
jgi:hypothetical protein